MQFCDNVMNQVSIPIIDYILLVSSKLDVTTLELYLKGARTVHPRLTSLVPLL